MHKPLFYIHGLDSSPQGVRARYFKAHFPDMLIPALPNDVRVRLDMLKTIIQEPACLVGSSLGGLTSLLLARDCPERIRAMVLIAPAVATFDLTLWKPEDLEEVNRLVIPAGIPTHVIAARQDDVIPLAGIEGLLARSPKGGEVPFQVFEDGHLLHTPEALEAQISAITTLSGIPAAQPHAEELPQI